MYMTRLLADRASQVRGIHRPINLRFVYTER
jgi:hypothetical protein